jgi:hypothetical protein
MRRAAAILCCIWVIGCEALVESGAIEAHVDPRVTRLVSERARAEVDPLFAPTIDEHAVVIATPNGPRARVDESGAQITHTGVELALQTTSVGRGAEQVTASSASIVGPEVHRHIGDAIEWWRALPSGLEHGFTLNERPAGEGPLRVEIAVRGATAALSSDAITLSVGGAPLLRYGELIAIDGASTIVPAHFEVSPDGTRIALVVDDATARYPLVIDPLVGTLEATLWPAIPLNNGAFGQFMSMSADATRIIVGTYNRPAVVFVRAGTTWTTEATLTYQGFAALSADGTRAIVAPGAGTVIYVRSGSTWAQEQTFSWSAAVSAVAMDGSGVRAAVSVNSTRVLVRSGTTWTQEANLTSTVCSTLAITRDGSLVACGDPGASSNSGAVSLYSRSGTTWSAVGTLTSTVTSPPQYFGTSLAFSADGLHLAVGAPETSLSMETGQVGGRVSVFTRASTTTNTWGTPIVGVAAGAPWGAQIGTSVAISQNGTRIAAGAPGDGTSGSVRVFVASYGATPSITYDSALTVTGTNLGSHGKATAISDDATRVADGAPGDSMGGVARAGSVRVFTVLEPNAGVCGVDSDCASGFCVSGACCSARCGSACQHCDATGTCVPNTAGTVCRPIAGPCDPAAEVCDGTAITCPAQSLSGSSTTCRPVAGACDVAETCTGTSAACPVDTLHTAGTMCAASRGGCDVPPVCSGTSASCPAPTVRASGAVCRVSAGVCDVPEVCDGSSFVCPGDAFAQSGVPCSAAGVATCGSGGTCTGTSAMCPDAHPLAAGTVCNPATTNPCDIFATCDGVSTACPHFAAATVTCGPTPAGACAAAYHCAGTSTACVAGYLTGVVCRAAMGSCDVAESCSGTSFQCPPDTVEGAGTVCRASTAMCDPAESCDGTNTMCPPDVTTCTTHPDSGAIDAGGSVDAGSVDASPTVDAASTHPAAGGCGCRAGGTGGGSWIALALIAWLARRRYGSRGSQTVGIR